MAFKYPRTSSPNELLDVLVRLREQVVTEAQHLFSSWRPHIQRSGFLAAGLNLAHYLSLRKHDLRDLQSALSYWGVSSLGRSEVKVLPTLDAVIATLAQLSDTAPTCLPERPTLRAFLRGERQLERQTERLFGPAPEWRRVRIMVTLPSEAAQDYTLTRNLLERGMTCARINCAHDAPDDWQRMIAHVRRAEAELGAHCKVFMDLAGPKARTGKVRSPHGKVRFKVGDSFSLVTTPDHESARTAPEVVFCLPEILPQLKVGAAIWFDDGRIGATITKVDVEGVQLRVTHARAKGEKLRSGKGINFPDTELTLSPLTKKDLQDLDFVVAHADLIGYSFVQRGSDIEALQRALKKRVGDHPLPAIIAKIETAPAVKNLPDIIVRAAGKQQLGVMIARGDLAVEIGYERLAEIQEEILWLCEAARVPVVWATQVLENLARKGVPSRSEVTDAAMAERAECVMLNKGPFIGEAVTTLDDVLTRMQAHQNKKTARLRSLRSWRDE